MPRAPRWVQQARADLKRVAALLPDEDPVELFHVLCNLRRPFGSGRLYFVKKSKDGRHVF